MSLYDRILGHPFVYHHVRPLVVGIDYTPQYAALAATAEDRILDIGCGGGDALRYLDAFASFHGYDTDEVAIAFAREREEAQREDVHFFAEPADRAVFEAVSPTCVMMNGLLHHLDDAAAVGVLELCATTPSVKRVVTNDTVYLDGMLLNNVMARLDRGRHVRHVPAYLRLAEEAGLRVARHEIVASHPKRGIARYLVMVLEPVRPEAPAAP